MNTPNIREIRDRSIFVVFSRLAAPAAGDMGLRAWPGPQKKSLLASSIPMSRLLGGCSAHGEELTH